MKDLSGLVHRHPARGIGALLAICLALALLSSAVWGASPGGAAGSRPAAPPASGQAPPQATPGQDFEDVLPSNPFYSYLHNLAHDAVVAGYTCGGANPPEPCIPPANLPYYRPGNTVTRLQMTKFIDLGRRNIADAVGNSLYISTTNGAPIYALTW